MSFIDTAKLEPLDKRQGWRGRLFHSASNTFVWWEFEEGADVHRHDHAQEEVWHVIDGELRVTVAGKSQLCGPGMVAIIPPHVDHSVVAVRRGRAIVVDHPLREGF